MPKRQQVTVLPKGLAAWRKQRGLTQIQLAKIVGCSETLIALIETGRRQPGPDNAVKIAEALDVELEAFAVVVSADDEVAA